MGHLFSRLLLATEHTDFDSGAEALALAMAARCNLPLRAVFPLVSNPEFEALAPEIAVRNEREAAVKLAQLREHAGSVTLEVCVRRGDEPYSEIVAEAVASAADLIITRRRGKRSFLANLLVGEMVSKVVSHAPCAVLLVPRGAAMWSREVLVAAEADAQGRDIVFAALELARECGLPLRWMCVGNPAMLEGAHSELRTAVGSLADRAGVRLVCETPDGKAHGEILAAATRSGADLIVMGSRRDSGIGRAMVGGVAQKVIGLAGIPVLVLHPRQKFDLEVTRNE